MNLKILKRGLSILLAATMVIMPNSNALAKTSTVKQQNNVSTATSLANSATGSAISYEDIKKTVDMKTSILTSIYGVTSLQYALIDEGKIVLTGQSGVNNKADGTTITDNSMFGIGSVSKMFTAAAVMQLVDQGKVNLDAPITNYIADFTMADGRYKKITVRMLLNHSSGLMGSTLNNSMLFDDDDFSTYNDFLDTLKTSRLKADPGEFSVYCNDGFTLAEILVEKVSGMSFTDYLKKYITSPLNLESTKTPLDIFNEDNLANTYLSSEKNPLPTDNVNMIGAGGIYSTAKDMCHFAEIFMKNSASGILSASSVNAMKNKEYLTDLWPEEADSSIAYGLGWDSVNTYPFDEYDIQALSKGGDTLLYHGNLIVLPDKNMAVAVLSSGGSSVLDGIVGQEILLQALKAKGIISEIKPGKTFKPAVKVSMPEDLKKYEGYYGLSGDIFKVKINDDGTMFLSDALIANSNVQKFIYTGDGKFYFSDGSAYLSFVEESNHETYLYLAGYAKLPSVGEFAQSGYQAQKIKDNSITQELKTVWDKRKNKKYYLVNEKYTSQIYASNTLSTKITMPEGLDGYCMNAAIVDENTAKADYQISGMNGRDLSDIIFFQVKDTEYLNIGGKIGISENAIKALSGKSKFNCSIADDGYAKWFKITKATANKKIKVDILVGASFAVYDEKGNCKNFSYISGKNTVTLPLNGHIVFVGDTGTKFTIRYQK